MLACPAVAESASELSMGGRVSEQEEIAAARRELGTQLAAWRVRAGLTQQELARRADYSRSTVAAVETGRTASAAFWAVNDRVLGAEGNLVGWHERTEATVTAIRRRAAQQVVEAQAAAAQSAGQLERGAVVVQDGPCPNCHYLLRSTTRLITELTVRAGEAAANDNDPA